MSNLNERFGALREWIEAQSVTTSLGALAIALVLFVIAQRLAQVSATTLRTTPTVVLASLLGTVLFVVSMVAFAFGVWRLVVEVRDRDLGSDFGASLDRFR